MEPLTHIDFVHEKASVLQTLYTQEMLKKGYLVGSSAYATYAYNNEILEQFKRDTEIVFGFLKTAIDSGRPEKFMLSNIKHSGFQRLS